MAFGLLAARFDYPDILRQPTGEVLARFRAGGTSLMLIWWGFALTAVVLAPVVVLLARAIDDADPTLLAVGATVGVLAALVQFLGLIRWPFLVAYLARADAEPDATPARREAVDVVFQSFNRYLGVAVGEHLGYGADGGVERAGRRRPHADGRGAGLGGRLGIVIGPLLMLCSLEFVGRSGGDHGWSVAEKLTPIAYVLWSLWLVVAGVALIA